MRWMSRPVFSLLLTLSLMVGCKQPEELEPDAGEVLAEDGAPPPVVTPKKDLGVAPTPDTVAALSPTKVAAIQYANKQYGQVAGCKNNMCALTELTRQARAAGASFVAWPEAYEAQVQCPDPAIGDNPTTMENVDADLKAISALAKELGIHLVANVFTTVGSDMYNTQIAFNPEGVIVGLHHKFNLFGNEPNFLKADPTASEADAFDTPLGKVGMLICADIYGNASLLTKLVKDSGVRIVVISSEWSVGNPITSYFKPFAKKWGVYVIVANVTNAGEGYGGVIADPQGNTINEVRKPEPSVLVGEIPLP